MKPTPATARTDDSTPRTTLGRMKDNLGNTIVKVLLVTTLRIAIPPEATGDQDLYGTTYVSLAIPRCYLWGNNASPAEQRY